ncbi:hypothetical protein ABT023_00010 [Micromonospora sp. NPDC002296]|uniref:hypothetical protein n=1 Tax=Micromonospora sp. NPDC002296 TaxID=3154271 RepID=UPI003316D6A1
MLRQWAVPLAVAWHANHVPSSQPRYEPIMVPPARPGRWRVWLTALFGALLLFFALLTVGQALYLNENGVITQAEIVDTRLGGRADFVRVRVSSGQETNLWAWAESPKVGATVSVVYLAESNWAKDARVFAPGWRIWPNLGMSLLFLVGALLERRRISRTSDRAFD